MLTAHCCLLASWRWTSAPSEMLWMQGSLCSSCRFLCILPGCCSQDGCVRTMHHLGKAGSQTRETFQSPSNNTDRPKPQNCSKFFTCSPSSHGEGCNGVSDESIVGMHYTPSPLSLPFLLQWIQEFSVVFPVQEHEVFPMLHEGWHQHCEASSQPLPDTQNQDISPAPSNARVTTFWQHSIAWAARFCFTQSFAAWWALKAASAPFQIFFPWFPWPVKLVEKGDHNTCGYINSVIRLPADARTDQWFYLSLVILCNIEATFVFKHYITLWFCNLKWKLSSQFSETHYVLRFPLNWSYSELYLLNCQTISSLYEYSRDFPFP